MDVLDVNPKEVIWTSIYKGLEGETHEVTLELAATSTSYGGLLTFLSSGETFELKGQVQTDPNSIGDLVNSEEIQGTLFTQSANGDLTLEYNQEKKTIGNTHPSYFVLEEFYNDLKTGKHTVLSSGDEMKINYLADPARIGMHYHFKKVKTLQAPNPVRYNFSSCMYETDQGDQILLHASPGSSSTISANLNGYESPLFEDYTVFVDPNTHQFSSGLTNKHGDPSIKIKGYEVDRSLLHVDLKKIDDADYISFPSETGFYKKACIQQKTIGHSNYYSSVDFAFPTLKNEAFNQEIKTIIFDYKKKHEAFIEGLDPSNNKDLFSPSNRSAHRSYSYYQTSYLSERFVSVLTYFSSTFLPNEMNALNYDLVNNQSFSEADLFDSTKDYKAFIKEYISTECTQLEYAEDDSFINFVKEEPFAYMLIGMNGLIYSTEWNGIFGNIKVYIPFEDLRPYFKNTPLVKSLLNEEK